MFDKAKRDVVGESVTSRFIQRDAELLNNRGKEQG